MNSIVSDIRHKVDKNKEVVFISGIFNILHLGHLRHLKFAKENGDFLVVGVLSDV